MLFYDPIPKRGHLHNEFAAGLAMPRKRRLRPHTSEGESFYMNALAVRTAASDLGQCENALRSWGRAVANSSRFVT